MLEKVLAIAVPGTDVCRAEVLLHEPADVGGGSTEFGWVADTVTLTTWVRVLSNEIKVPWVEINCGTTVVTVLEKTVPEVGVCCELVAVGSVAVVLRTVVTSLDVVPDIDGLVLPVTRVLFVDMLDPVDLGIVEGTGGPAGEEVVASGRDEGLDFVVLQGCQDGVLEPVTTLVNVATINVVVQVDLPSQ